jgi:hypothetical protein
VRGGDNSAPAPSSAPQPSAPRVTGVPQPDVLARTRLHTSAAAPLVSSASAGRSSADCGPCDSGSRARDSATAATPIGTFSQKIHCQSRPSVTAPPISGCAGELVDGREISLIRRPPSPLPALSVAIQPQLGEIRWRWISLRCSRWTTIISSYQIVDLAADARATCPVLLRELHSGRGVRPR